MFMAAAASIFPRIEEERYLALLRAANAIATSSDCEAAADTLVKRLHEVTPFDYLHLIAFDKDTDLPCWSLLEANGKRLESGPGEDFSIEDSPIESVHASGDVMVSLEWSQETRFQKYGTLLSSFGISSPCPLPLTRGSRRLGVLSVGRFYPNAYDEEEVRFLG